MIFSLSQGVSPITIPELENTDVICFFRAQASVVFTRDLWFEILLTSLKMKRNVLILEEDFKTLSKIDFSQRWQIGEAYTWIAPRAHSVLLSSYPKKDPSLENIRSQLKNAK